MLTGRTLCPLTHHRWKVISPRRASPYGRRMIRALLISAALCLPVPLFAQSVEGTLQAQFLPGWQSDDGSYMAAIRLTLTPGWKTYWRAPGDAGIPPEFDWAGSGNLSDVRLIWPTPTVMLTNGMQSIVYHDQLVLPISVTPRNPDEPTRLRLHLAVGICKDICMPASVDLAVDLTGKGADDPMIRAALASRPATSAEAGVTAIFCSVTPIDDGLRLHAEVTLPRQGPTETVAFELADKTVWIASAETSRNGPTLMAETDLVPSTGAAFALDRSSITLTVLTEGRSVEIQGCPAG